MTPSTQHIAEDNGMPRRKRGRPSNAEREARAAAEAAMLAKQSQTENGDGTELAEPTTPASRPRGRPPKPGRMTTVEVVPDPSLMMKIGRTGYSLAEILAEFIDNSIDARVGDTVHVEVAIDDRKVSIEDDARGMTKQQLVDALTIAKSTKQNALGEYGIGMKAASVALANAFTIDTTTEDAEYGHRVSWNAQQWVSQGTWSYQVETRAAPKKMHGTSIVLQALKFAPGRRVGIVKNELGRRFGPFIRSGELMLTVNGTKCRAPEPELLPADVLSDEIRAGLGKKEKFARMPFALKTQSGKEITGWVGLLANSSQKGLYGFDMFRRGRLITYSDKFGFSAHPTVARLVGEIHMDHVPVTSNKREWVKTDPLYEDCEETIKAFIGPWLAEARRLTTVAHALKPVENARLNAFKDGLAAAFQSPDLKGYTTPAGGMPSERGRGQVEVPVEQRAERSDKGGEHGERAEPANVPDGARERHPRQFGDRTKTLKVAGRTFDYEHRFGNLGANAPWSEYQWDAKQRHLLVISNADSPVFAVAKDTSVLAWLHVVDACAHVCIQETERESDLGAFEEVRQVLIRESAKHVASL